MNKRNSQIDLKTIIADKTGKGIAAINNVLCYWYGNKELSSEHPVEIEIIQQCEQELVQALIDEKKKWCEEDAQKLLDSSDWVTLSDINLQNKEEWLTYRNILRNFRTNPVEDPIFPAPPAIIWD